MTVPTSSKEDGVSQGSLFDASVYIMRAYDQLVLAYSEAELEQLRSLKSQTMRTWLAVQELAIGQEHIADSAQLTEFDDQPF